MCILEIELTDTAGRNRIADSRFGQHIVGMVVTAQFLRQRCMAFIASAELITIAGNLPVQNHPRDTNYGRAKPLASM